MAKQKLAPIAASAGNVKAREGSTTHNFREIPRVSGEIVTVKAVKGLYETQARIALKGSAGNAIVCFLPAGWLNVADHIGSKATIERKVEGDDFTGREVKWNVEIES